MIRFLLLTSFLLVQTHIAWAQAEVETLITDITSHRISISSSFIGTRLHLFGTVEHFQGGDIVVVVRGPDQVYRMRKKAKTWGIWVNRHNVEIHDIPGFYALITSTNRTSLAEDRILARHQIGERFLPFRAVGIEDPEQLEGFRHAFSRAKRRDGLYLDLPSQVQFVGGSLFRTALDFPAQVPIGNYVAQVFLLREGRVISAQTTPLFVSKSGAEQRVFDLAHKQPFLYGAMAVIIAVLAGFIAASLFRKDV